jgi:DnaJ-class molecular chaperone
MPNHDFLTRLSSYLYPTKPVQLQTKETAEVEGILTLTSQQAKAGKTIRLQLDDSHCEKFNLPRMLQVQLPKNLQEGQRLKITKEAWQMDETAPSQKNKFKQLGKTTQKPNKNNSASLVLVVCIQEKQSAISTLLTLGGLIPSIQKATKKPKSLFPSPPPTTALEEEDPLLSNAFTPNADHNIQINPTLIAEQITIPLPLAILGGVYDFTTTTAETITIPIPSGISPQTTLSIASNEHNNTLFEVKVNWHLPVASGLSSEEKRLYETLVLLSLTEEAKIKDAQQATQNQQTAEEA